MLKFSRVKANAQERVLVVFADFADVGATEPAQHFGGGWMGRGFHAIARSRGESWEIRNRSRKNVRPAPDTWRCECAGRRGTHRAFPVPRRLRSAAGRPD